MPNQKPMDVRVVLWEIAHLAKAGFYEMKSPMIGNEQKALAILEAFAEEKVLEAFDKKFKNEHARCLEIVRAEERAACAKVFDGAITLLEKLAQHGGPATVRDLRLLKEWQEKIRSRVNL